MKIILSIFLFIFLLSNAFCVPEVLPPHIANDSSKTDKKVVKDGLEKVSDVVKVDSIRRIIENDMLLKEIKKHKTRVIKKKTDKVGVQRAKYQFPDENDFWKFMTEYWLVANAQKLKWDFEKPDYGIKGMAAELFQKIGFFEKKINILILKTSLVQHFALPLDGDNIIFVISLPFMRILDLSKLEISLLILEGYLRVKLGMFKSKVESKLLRGSFAKNFYVKNFDPKIVKGVLKKYSDTIYKDGYNFQDQYEVTKQMGEILKTDMKLFVRYMGLLKKIDNLIKSNLLYRNYNKIYPSPELQINWLKPKKRRL